jgi:thiamine-phosphate pyrophosphorylase
MSESDVYFAQLTRFSAMRILDANFNRATEALRVMEEYARFVLESRLLAEQLKQLRHDLTAAMAAVPPEELLQARDIIHDVGAAATTSAEYRRADLLDVVLANAKRAEQALRVLEEYGKLFSPELGQAFEQARYAAYGLNQQLGRLARPREMLAGARLYVLLDGGRDLDTFRATCQGLVDAGVDVLQLRDKRLDDRALLACARAAREVTLGKTLLIVNDRPDLAALAQADGVHVGQEELSVRDARSILGPRGLVGVSTHSRAQAQAAERDGADYLGCGPTFPSGTKSFAEFPGLAYLREVAAEFTVPAFAIGGITLDNVDDVLATGITRIAVSAAVTQADDPAAAARQLRARLDADSR